MKKLISVLSFLALVIGWQGASGEPGGLESRGYPEESAPIPKQDKKKTKAVKKKSSEKVSAKKKNPPPAKVVKQEKRQRTTPKSWDDSATTEKALTAKQEAMRQAFAECIARSTANDPVDKVIDFVFQKQAEREQGGIATLWRAFRGSPDHHGQEVCLARAYGLKTFRDLADIQAAHGTLLVPISGRYINVIEKEIPADRRYGRPWMRDYLQQLASDLNAEFRKTQKVGVPVAELRVTSIIRAADAQQLLVQKGLSPADCRYSYLCSTHTSGSAVDIGLLGATSGDMKMLERRLMADQRARKIFFIRENSHFHIFVIPPEFMDEE